MTFSRYIIYGWPLIYGEIAEILVSCSCRKPGSRNVVATSNFGPDVEMWPFSHFGLGYGAYHVPQNSFLVLPSIKLILAERCNYIAKIFS